MGGFLSMRSIPSMFLVMVVEYPLRWNRFSLERRKPGIVEDAK